MLKGIRKKSVYVIASALILVLTAVVIGATDGAAPGSEQDPIVTQSYVEQKTEQMKFYIDSLVAKVNEEIAKLNTGTAKLSEDYTVQGSELARQSQEIINLKAQLEQKNQEIAKLQEDVKVFSGIKTKFEVVELQKNQVLIAGEGAEIIPRSGKYTAIFGTNGGLSDITSAKDLKNGEAIVMNHMLIASRGDGRGLKAVQDKSFLIIKGTYTVK